LLGLELRPARSLVSILTELPRAPQSVSMAFLCIAVSSSACV